MGFGALDAGAGRRRVVSRRGLLVGSFGLAAATTAGCGTFGTHRPQAPATTDDLFAGEPFYIAHRGGGYDWPEMTAFAYDQAVQVPGLKAIEISVCATSDGVLVCNHDATTRRLCGVDYTIANETWETLSGLRVTAAYTRDPTQPSRPLARFEDVIEAHLDSHVVFVEPKTPPAVEPLMSAMSALGQPERVVWKQPVNQQNFARAKGHGFSTWGYVLNEPSHLGDRLAQFAASDTIDRLGAPRTENDRFVTDIVTAAARHDKQTIMWNIRTVADRARALRLGCQGLMTSEITGVMAAPLSA